MSIIFPGQVSCLYLFTITSEEHCNRSVRVGHSIPCRRLSAPITPAKAFSSARPFSQTTTCVNMRAWATSHVNIPPPVQDCISSACWVVTEPVPSLSLSMCLGEAIPVVSTLFHTVRKVTGMWQPYQFHHSSWQLHPCCF